MLIMFKTFCAKHAIFDLNMKILNDCIDVFSIVKKLKRYKSVLWMSDLQRFVLMVSRPYPISIALILASNSSFETILFDFTLVLYV